MLQSNTEHGEQFVSKNGDHMINLFAAALMIQTITLPAQGAGTCLVDKSDIAADMQKITHKFNLKYEIPKLQKGRYKNTELPNDFYIDEQLKVDRSDRMLSKLNAFGVITDSPMNSLKSYASAVLISPCHVLVNAHGVISKDQKLGKENVYISLGQNSCDAKNEFLHQDMPGKVIAIGDLNEVDIKVRTSKDYAIVRIKQITDIEAPIVSMDYIKRTDTLATVDFPFSTTYSQKSGLRYPTLNFTRKTTAGNDGTLNILNKNALPGSSGSGIFLLDKNENNNTQLVLSAINIGYKENGIGGIALHTAAIVQHLQATNLKAYNELVSAIDNNTCNQNIND